MRKALKPNRRRSSPKRKKNDFFAFRIGASVMVLAVSFVFGSFVKSSLAAWSEPTDIPPLGNVLAPIWNQNSTTQTGNFSITGSGYIGGNLGVGTTNPFTKFYLIGDYASYSSAATSLASPVGGSIYIGDINFNNGSYYNSAPGISAVYNAGMGVASDLAFYTYTGAAGSRTERMRILFGGNVGIGITNPGTKLHLYDAASGPIITLSGLDSNYRGVTIKDTSGNEEWFYGNNSSNNFVIRRTGSTNDILINSSGYVGIGNVASPAEALDVNGRVVLAQTTAPGTTANKLYNVGGNLYWNGTQLGSGGAAQTPWTSNINAAGYTLFGNSTASGNLTLDSTSSVTKGYVLLNPVGGNVGIGISSPIGKLDIFAGASRTGTAPTTPALYVTANLFDGTAGPTGSNIEFRHDNQTQGIGFGYQTMYATGSNATQPLNLLSRGSSPITLNAYAYSTGNVGIGNTSPGQLLTVGAAGKLGTLGLAGSTSGVVTVQPAAAAGTWTLTLPVNDGDANQFLQTNGSGVTVWAAAAGGGGTVTSSGSATYIPKFTTATNIGNSLMYDNGTGIGIGTTSPSYNFHVVSSVASGRAIYATSSGASSYGVYGSGTSAGVRGNGGSYGVYGSSSGGYGVYGTDSAGGNGVYGYSNTGTGIRGDSSSGDAVSGNAWGNGNALYGSASGSGYGVFASSVSGYGVYGSGTRGVYGTSSSGNGIYGNTTGSGIPAIEGHATSGAGVAGYSNSGYGLFGSSVNTYGVYGTSSSAAAIYADGVTYGFYTPDGIYAGGNLVFGAANPTISSSSYVTFPGGAYFSSGITYFQSQAQFRGGIHNDSSTYLTVAGGTSGITYFSGSVGIGTASPGYALQVQGASYASSGFYGPYGAVLSVPGYTNTALLTIGWYGVVNPPYCPSGNCDFFSMQVPGSGSNPGYFQLFDTGSMYLSGTLGQGSDRRLKKDIVDLDTKYGLDTIMALKPRTFYWNYDGAATSEQIGLIAQEVQPLLPQLVGANTKGTLSINYIGIIPSLILSIQQQQVEIDDLKQRIGELEIKIQ